MAMVAYEWRVLRDLHQNKGHVERGGGTNAALESLKGNGYIIPLEENRGHGLTDKGRAALAAGPPPEEGEYEE